jgi:Uma2 family endonuclease
MTVLPPIAKPISQMQLAPGSVVTFPNVSWPEFEAILQELGESRSARVAYSHHTLEIMVPLPEHEKPKDIVSDIIKILLKSTGRKYEPFGSTTFKREGIAGVEPDVCFYIQNYRQMIQRRRLEPTDPPPDLAIELDVTSKTTFEAYQAIGVPEIWVYARRTLMIYVLQAGEYVTSPISPIFPEMPLTQMIPTVVERAWQVGTSQALAEFEHIIRDL